MSDRVENELATAIRGGDERAFEQAFRLYEQRVRLVAWRICGRADWLDDLVNETWCRAFDQRQRYEPQWPFLVWVSGIARNVFREMLRRGPLQAVTGQEAPRPSESDVEALDPETLAHEAEVLAGLNECMSRLGPEEARIVRLRFFDGLPLRSVAQEVNLAEATLRERVLPRLLDRLRRCLAEKKIEFSSIFSAREGDDLQ